MTRLLALLLIATPALGMEYDKQWHFYGSAALTLPAHYALRELPAPQRLAGTFGLALLPGIGKELSDRIFDTRDLTYDAAGALTGALLMEIIRYMLDRG